MCPQQGRSAAQQREAVIAGFPTVPAWFRKLFPYSKWGAELNARITPAFFTWLVGPMQTVEATLSDGTTQQSGVHIERCRYAHCHTSILSVICEKIFVQITSVLLAQEVICSMDVLACAVADVGCTCYTRHIPLHIFNLSTAMSY